MPTASASRQNDPVSGRVEWVDFAKGLGIFLVVFGHVLGGLQGSGVLADAAWSEFVLRYIYIFHMPLFFFLAGLFVAKSARRPFYGYFLNKLSVIAYPYFVWSIIEGIVQYLSSKVTNTHLSFGNFYEIIYQPIDQYWFLYVIFFMYMAYWLLNKRVSNNLILAISVLLYALETNNLVIPHWEALQSFCVFFVYFALGAKAAETPFFTSLGMSKRTILAGLSIGGYALVALVAAVGADGPPFIHLGLAAAGAFATIALAMLVSASNVWTFIRIAGVYSLEIYVSHTIFSAGARIVMQKGLGYSGPLLHIVVATAAGMGLPILLAMAGPKVGLPYLFTWSRSRRKAEFAAIDLPVT